MRTRKEALLPMKEAEPTPKVRFTFFGFEHADVNGQGNARMLRLLREHLQKTPGRTTLFLEEATMVTPGEALDRQRMIADSGGTRSLLRGILTETKGMLPSDQEVDRYQKLLEDVTIQQMIDNHNFPLEALRHYFLWRGIDQIMKEANKDRERVRVVYESHSPQVVAKVSEAFREVNRLATLGEHMWHEGRFEGLLPMQKVALVEALKTVDERRNELADSWRRIIQDFLKKPEGGGLYTPFGKEHQDTARVVAGRFTRGDVVALVQVPESADIFDEMSDIVRSSNGNPEEAIPDILSARGILRDNMQQALMQVMRDEMLLDAYFNNYETIQAVLDRIARTFTLGEIRAICEEKQDLFAVLSHHPGFSALGAFLRGV